MISSEILSTMAHRIWEYVSRSIYIYHDISLWYRLFSANSL